jgi:PAS domain S-box-containing protein
MGDSVREHIRWHRRMEARVVAGLTLLVALSLAGVLLAANRVATRRAVAQAADHLERGRTAFYSLVDERAAVAAQQTRLIIELPIFRSVMTDPVVASDVATLTQTADTYRQNLGARFCIVTDPAGKATAIPGWPTTAVFPPRLESAIRGAVTGESRRDLVAVEKQLFLVISEPARFAEAEIVGTVTFGFPLDDRVARDLAAATHSEVNLVSGTRLLGTSLDGEAREQVAAAVANGDLFQTSGISNEVRTFGQHRFIGGVFPLARGGGSEDAGRLVLMQDWAPTQRFLDDLRNSLLAAGVAAFVLALAGGFVFSRRTSRPLIDIAAAAREIADGNWQRAVPERGSAEAITMARAFNNMTDRLRDQADRLNASYQRFSTVTQSARDAIISTEANGLIAFWSRSAEAIFGYSESEALGSPITMLIDEADRDRYRAALPRPEDEEPTFGNIIEVTGIRKDGGTFACEVSLAALNTPRGATFTAIIRDVVERKHVEDALKQRDEQLRQAQKMEAIGRLAGGVAHDFNNLLMAIRGYAEILVEGLSSDDNRKDAEEIVKASDRAAGLTHQLLAFSRKQVITQQAIALDELIAGMEDMLRRLIGDHIQLTTENWPDLMPVLGDRTQLEQIIVNLVVNARDAMAGAGKITIGIRNIELDKIGVAAHPGLQPGDYIEMAFSDTGSGMDADTVSRIFEPFFTTKAGGKGTGLGLATVYGIVQQSGGAIEVQSKVGCGTTFYIYLPCAAEFGRPAPIRPQRVSGSETILLVEDDDRVRALVSSMLKKNGYKVLLASQGDQALEIAAKHQGRIDLLLTDVMMPGISGRVLSERLTFARPDTRVLYMSGYSDDAILRHGVKSAASYFIQKPFSIDALAHRIRDILSSPGNVRTTIASDERAN